MKKNRSLWEPKRRIEAAFRRRLLAITRTIVRKVKETNDPDEIQRILLQITRTKEYQKLCQSAAMKMVMGLRHRGRDPKNVPRENDGQGRTDPPGPRPP